MLLKVLQREIILGWVWARLSRVTDDELSCQPTVRLEVMVSRVSKDDELSELNPFFSFRRMEGLLVELELAVNVVVVENDGVGGGSGALASLTILI